MERQNDANVHIVSAPCSKVDRLLICGEVVVAILTAVLLLYAHLLKREGKASANQRNLAAFVTYTPTDNIISVFSL